MYAGNADICVHGSQGSDTVEVWLGRTSQCACTCVLLQSERTFGLMCVVCSYFSTLRQ